MTEGMTSGARNRTDVPHIEHRELNFKKIKQKKAEKSGYYSLDSISNN